METFLRNSSYIFLFLKVLPWRETQVNLKTNIVQWNGSGDKWCSHHEYSPVAVSVNSPQLDIGLGFNGGCPRCPVDQGQLSKAAALPNAGHPLIIHIHLPDEEH